MVDHVGMLGSKRWSGREPDGLCVGSGFGLVEPARLARGRRTQVGSAGPRLAPLWSASLCWPVRWGWCRLVDAVACAELRLGAGRALRSSSPSGSIWAAHVADRHQRSQPSTTSRLPRHALGPARFPLAFPISPSLAPDRYSRAPPLFAPSPPSPATRPSFPASSQLGWPLLDSGRAKPPSLHRPNRAAFRLLPFAPVA